MKKLLITLITISIFAISACGDGSDESPAPPSNPDPVETAKPFIWGESTWGDIMGSQKQ